MSIATVRTVLLAEMLGDLEDQAIALIVGLQRVQDRRQMPIELHVNDGADHLGDASLLVGFACGCGFGHVVPLTKFLNVTAPRRRR